MRITQICEAPRRVSELSLEEGGILDEDEHVSSL